MTVFRAQFVGLSQAEALGACASLARMQADCLPLAPGISSATSGPAHAAGRGTISRIVSPGCSAAESASQKPRPCRRDRSGRRAPYRCRERPAGLGAVTCRSCSATLPSFAARSPCTRRCGPRAPSREEQPAKLAGLMTVVAPAWRAKSALSSAVTTTLIATRRHAARGEDDQDRGVVAPGGDRMHFARSIFTASSVALRVASPSSTATPQPRPRRARSGAASITTICAAGGRGG